MAEELQRAILDPNLRNDVVAHTRYYFEQQWARYEDIPLGKLWMVPNEELVGVLRSDFANMEIMFFEGEQPNLEIIIEQLEELEQRLNAIEST